MKKLFFTALTLGLALMMVTTSVNASTNVVANSKTTAATTAANSTPVMKSTFKVPTSTGVTATIGMDGTHFYVIDAKGVPTKIVTGEEKTGLKTVAAKALNAADNANCVVLEWTDAKGKSKTVTYDVVKKKVVIPQVKG